MAKHRCAILDDYQSVALNMADWSKVAGDLAGRPGWLYAKLLVGEQGASPLPFWVPGSEVRDTRLSPGRADQRSFVFSGPVARIEVRLWYRAFWHEVAAARGWTDNDMLVAERTIHP